MFKSLYALLLALAFTTSASAAPPSTLGYQGRLATAGGQPITANLSITFRIYDVASGGSALWTETQPSVPVDGGNLAVELGKLTPLPRSIFGKQLYLGVQVAGDSEMLPRPPLTAAPFALRAAATMKNTVHVSAEGSPTENGTALLAAATAAASNPGTAIELDAGIYDLGPALLDIPAGTTLSGRSQLSTRILSTSSIAAVRFASNTEGRDFTAVATGTPADGTSAVTAVMANSVANDGPVQNVRIEHVTGSAEGANGALGARNGFYICTTNSRVSNVSGFAQGGQFGVAFRADCQNGQGNIFEHVVATTSGSTTGLRGAYLSGARSTWTDFKANVAYNATAESTYGIRVFSSPLNAPSLLSDAIVHIAGNAIQQAVESAVEGIRIDNANVEVERSRVTLEATRVAYAWGMRINSIDGNPVVRVTDVNVSMSGVQAPVGGFGEMVGIISVNAAPQLSRVRVDVRCTAGGTNGCHGILRRANPMLGNLQSGILTVDHADVSVVQVNAADSTAFTTAFLAIGQSRITGSTLSVQRSPFGENHSVVSTPTDASVLVLDSTLLVDSTATPTPDCVLGGNGSSDLIGSVIQGNICVSGPAPACVGVSRRAYGSVLRGFFASTCP